MLAFAKTAEDQARADLRSLETISCHGRGEGETHIVALLTVDLIDVPNV